MKSIKSVYKIGNGPSSSHTVGPYHAARTFGNRYPDADQQLRIYKVLGINPIELLTGEEMWDKELKKKIEEYIRNCEHADTMFRFIDDNGAEQVLNLIDFDVVATDEKGHLTGEWVPFEDWQEMNKKKKKA